MGLGLNEPGHRSKKVKRGDEPTRIRKPWEGHTGRTPHVTEIERSWTLLLFDTKGYGENTGKNTGGV